jgi:hypothetical protein
MRLLPFSLIVFLALQGVFSLSVEARRAIFNQDSETIIGFFGVPQEQLVGWKTLVYTYQPSDLKTLSPDYPNLKFSFIFHENKLTSVTLIFDENDITSSIVNKSYNYDQEIAGKFFQYLFDYPSTTWEQKSNTFTGNATIYNYEYCLGDGVANNFSRSGIAQMTYYVVWYYNPQCE